MTVLITGATGFIGSRLALRCLANGDEVVALGQINNSAEAERRRLIDAAGAKVVVASVTDLQAVRAAARGVEVVYHLAAVQHEAHAPDQRFWDINVNGTRTVLEASAAEGVKRFVHGSSIGVYGTTDAPTDEHSPLAPDNIYGVTKLEGERVVLSFQDRLPIVIVRISETYGPGDRRLLKLFRGIGRRAFLLIGPGTNLHHPVYIDDLVEGLLLAAAVPAAIGRTLVLAGKDVVTTRQMVDTIAAELGRAPSRLRVPLWPVRAAAAVTEGVLRPLGVHPPLHRRRLDFFRKSFRFSGGEAREVLGFEPRVDFARGVADTATFYRARGELSPPRSTSPAEVPSASAHPRAAAAMSGELKVIADMPLTAKIEPFDSFWEGPANVEKGYYTFGQFYRHNYLSFLPSDRSARILAISCGPGYLVDLLTKEGFPNVLGIDSFPEKVEQARRRNLNCIAAEAFPFLYGAPGTFDAIVCEQELNHLTKEEILKFLQLCRHSLKTNGTLIVHTLNGGNPITGAEALAQNFDHYNTFTEYTFRQVLSFAGFQDIRVIPLKLYVFYRNPLNYVLILISALYTAFFRLSFILYGKSNRIFTKKIAAICRNAPIV
jgi:nucleoside-diphosphate-sugar epimerase/2-polyprenyl-3-methyl-5-hydroxy-6-metoxy-1,4-benzoquinol methylase